MKLTNYFYISTLTLTLTLTGCESGTNEFPDFDYQTVYFANQYAERTIELGEDEFVDLTMDNQKKVSIKAAWGGGYDNRKDVKIDISVDPSLCGGLYFAVDGEAGAPVEVMPANYYTLSAESITIPKGEIIGGVDVQLTDAFFADSKSISANYVIPVKMNSVSGADSILSAKDYILYAVKYVNPWHGQYLRRGKDEVSADGTKSTVVRHEEFVENDDVVDVTTLSLMNDVLPITVKDADGTNITFNVKLSFNESGACTVGSDDENVKISGSGSFVKKGEKNSLGGKDRDAIYLKYTTELLDKGMTIATEDTLVLRTRNVVGAGTFNVIQQ